MNILVADDELAIRSLVAEILEDEGHEVTVAEDGKDALQKFRFGWHDIVFSDIRMPQMTGIELLAEIKKINENTQFIIMTSHASIENSIEALKQGAFDYILKPFEDLEVVVDAAKRAMANLSAIRKQKYLLTRLSRQNEELGTLNRKFRVMAISDGLTGLFNHRHAQDRLVEEFDRAKNFGRDLSVLFMDLDHFKYYNDSHGHQAGDQILQLLGAILKEMAGDSDVVARWGGEEFIIIAPETDADHACTLAEDIRLRVAEYDFPHAGNQPLGRISVSIGVATTSATIADVESLVRQADNGAYHAKETGRNRAVFCGGGDKMKQLR